MRIHQSISIPDRKAALASKVSPDIFRPTRNRHRDLHRNPGGSRSICPALSNLWIQMPRNDQSAWTLNVVSLPFTHAQEQTKRKVLGRFWSGSEEVGLEEEEEEGKQTPTDQW